MGFRMPFFGLNGSAAAPNLLEGSLPGICEDGGI